MDGTPSESNPGELHRPAAIQPLFLYFIVTVLCVVTNAWLWLWPAEVIETEHTAWPPVTTESPGIYMGPHVVSSREVRTGTTYGALRLFSTREKESRPVKTLIDVILPGRYETKIEWNEGWRFTTTGAISGITLLLALWACMRIRRGYKDIHLMVSYHTQRRNLSGP